MKPVILLGQKLEPAIDSSLLKYTSTVLHFVIHKTGHLCFHSFIFLLPFVKAQGATKTMCVGSMAAVVRGPDLSNRTPTGDPETPRQGSLTVLLYSSRHHNDFASIELHLSVQVCSFIHASLCKSTCYDSPTLHFLPPPT